MFIWYRKFAVISIRPVNLIMYIKMYFPLARGHTWSCCYWPLYVIWCRMPVYRGIQWPKVILKAVRYSIVPIRQTSLVNTRPSMLATATTIKNYLDEKQFTYKEGHTSYMLECPVCDATVKQETGSPQYCFHVNKTTGSVTCLPCRISGNYNKIQ